MIFRKLDDQEAKKFQQAARNEYKPFTPISGLWHPVYQAECVKINTEQAEFSENESANHFKNH